MGGSSGKGAKTTQTKTETSAPPEWAAPLFKRSAKDAMDLYNSGQGGNVYQGSRVADLSEVTKNAISGLGNATANYGNSYLQGLAGGKNASGQNLADMASGKMVGANTAYNQALQNTLDNTATTINSQMSGAGRYGSGAHSGVLSRQLGQAATTALSNQYNQDVGNMLNANELIDRANNNQLSAASNYFQGQGNNFLNALKGGTILDQNNQQKLDAARDQWNEEDNRGWNRLAMLLSAAQGAAGNYGTSSGTQTTKQQNGALTTIGNGLGALSSLFGLSDQRTKENIRYAGKRNGYNVYDFNYIGRTERYRGVIAQEILKTDPDKVVTHPESGLLMVNYNKLGFPMERLL